MIRFVENETVLPKLSSTLKEHDFWDKGFACPEDRFLHLCNAVLRKEIDRCYSGDGMSLTYTIADKGKISFLDEYYSTLFVNLRRKKNS